MKQEYNDTWQKYLKFFNKNNLEREIK